METNVAVTEKLRFYVCAAMEAYKLHNIVICIYIQSGETAHSQCTPRLSIQVSLYINKRRVYTVLCRAK